ncbi:MAG: ATP-dependent DNA helicase RecG [Candidatus Andersenbacteria bacterium]|nr:ATP-dependent DNA helicase RecG [bacterium]MDZ4225765.1 ATP-dependent DNA helicase RecG [Candidatus Andersenbacteria bacterium]
MSPQLRLSSPVTDLSGIGPAKAQALAKLHITHVRDFLYTFPRRYDDFSTITPIDQLKPGQTSTIRGRVKSVKTSWGWRGRQRLLRIFVDIEDDTGILAVTWFNLRFLPKQLWQGRELFVAGKIEANEFQRKLSAAAAAKLPKFRLRSPVIEFITANLDQTHTGRITPVYPETYGVSSRFIRYQTKNLLPLIQAIPEYLPAPIRSRHKLLGIHQAVYEAHFPSSTEQLSVAQARLRFDELFFLQLAALVRRRDRRQKKAFKIPANKTTDNHFFSLLPFQLTGAQTEAIREIAGDLNRTIPMNRLLQGDVGSGKSVVALYAAYLALSAGYSVLYLAPTEVLARQQANSFTKFLGADKVALLISAIKTKAKKEIKHRLASPQSLCIVGTHALLQEDVLASRCALAIIDEQHRFGVAQRRTLQNINSGEKIPHLLSMTATPIPRTLNLTVYGDLDVSVLNELPPGRRLIKTNIVSPSERDDAIIHILQELHSGRQAYVVAPLVEESDKLQVKSAKQTYREMQHLFPDVAVGLLHGQMPSDEKESVLNNFNAGAIQLLVATAVIEVGIDVPNATIMIIEGAERFGLAQLHQFRGRVGRGVYQSYCYLFPTTEETTSSKRLQVLTETNDGFIIAEEDLKLRGPGEIYGLAQSGFGNLQVASLLDYATIKKARAEATTLLEEDPNLKNYPILRKKVEQKNLVTHFE